MKRQRIPSTLDSIDLELIENYIRHANEGNPKSVLLLMSIFSNQVKRGEQVEDSLLEFVADCFKDILSGVKPAKALRLTRPHRRPTKNFSRDLNIAVKIRKMMDEQITLEDAAAKLSEEYGLNESQLQNIYSKYKQIAIGQIKAGIVVT